MGRVLRASAVFVVTVGAMAMLFALMPEGVGLAGEGLAALVLPLAVGRWLVALALWIWWRPLLGLLGVGEAGIEYMRRRRHWYLAVFVVFECVLAIAPAGVLGR